MMWGVGFGWVWMLVVWVAVVSAAVWFVTQLTAGDGGRRASPDARQVLDERFARGELELDEYRRRRRELAS